MNCHEFEDRLHRLLDDRQSPEADASLAAHAAECPPCGQLLVGQRLLLAGLRLGVAAGKTSRAADRQLAHAVLADFQDDGASVHRQARGRSRRVWQVVAWVASTAAALAIAVSIYQASQPRRPSIAVASPQHESKTGGPVARSLHGKSLASIEAAPKHDRPSRRSVLGGLPLLPRAGYGVTLADMATSSIPQAVERIEEVERYAPGIRPIRVSFAMLWNALWRSLPGFGGDEPDPSAWYGRHDSRPIV